MEEPTLLMVASDVGPARYLMQLHARLDRRMTWWGSDLTEPLYARAGLETWDSSDRQSRIGAVIAGTCLGPGPDKDAIRLASTLGVPSVVAVDHWTLFFERFVAGPELLLPSVIVVNDEIALRLACNAGLPSDLLRVCGNPVLEGIGASEVSLSGRQKVNRGKNIVFISEEVASTVSSGKMPPVGYSEFEILELVLSCRSDDDRVIVKLHPEEDEQKYVSYQGEISVWRQASSREIAEVADVVVGMRSFLLLELAAMGCSVISCQDRESAPFIGDLLGATRSARTREGLQQLLEVRPLAVSPFVEKYRDTTTRWRALIEEVLQGCA